MISFYSPQMVTTIDTTTYTIVIEYFGIGFGRGENVEAEDNVIGQGIFIIIIVMSEFIVRLLQLDHRCITTVERTRANKSQLDFCLGVEANILAGAEAKILSTLLLI